MIKSQINALMTAFHSAITSNQRFNWMFHSNSLQFQLISFFISFTYRSEIMNQALMLNSNKDNVSSKSSTRKFKLYVLSKNLFNHKISKNQRINEIKIWFFQKEKLCVKCNHVRHVNKECKNNMLFA